MGGGERVLWCAVAKLMSGAMQSGADDQASASSDRNIDGKINMTNPSVIYIYSRKENCTAEAQERILKAVEKRFGFPVLNNSTMNDSTKTCNNKKNNRSSGPRIELVPLKTLWLAEPRLYPVFTILGQSLGSMVVALEGLLYRKPCETFIESTGFAFTFPIAKIAGSSRILAYVHYPTMSSDMLTRVRMNVEMYNNKGAIAKSGIMTSVKILYYKLFLALYGACGRYFADFLWCNSSWTRERIVGVMGETAVKKCETSSGKENTSGKEENMSGKEENTSGKGENTSSNSCGSCCGGASAAGAVEESGRGEFEECEEDKRKIQLLYPPIDLSSLKSIGDNKDLKQRENILVSLAQFRPEKEQRLQILGFRKALEKLKMEGMKAATQKSLPEEAEKEKDATPHLYICGGTRPREAFPEDELLVEELKKLVKDLHLENNITLRVNVPFAEMLQLFSRAKIALHSMRDEHFGITLVEFLASRLITVCHASGGPKTDIFVSDFSRQFLYGGRKGVLSGGRTGETTTVETEDGLTDEIAEKIVKGLEIYDKDETRQILDKEVQRARETFGDNDFFGEEIRKIVCGSPPGGGLGKKDA